ncbi:MAG: hypothetical protein H7Z16_01865 [Pyrinomonadaceae bacterium]|nr:hypothetical protein [Pyrinomonadaceae bacterium]
MISSSQILELIRSISFAALGVCFFLYLAFTYHPSFFPSDTTTREIIFIGSAIGTIVHRALHAAMFNPLTKSIARSFAFYAKVVELDLNRRLGIIDENEFRRFGGQVRTQYFGSSESAIVLETKKTPDPTLRPGDSEGKTLKEPKSRKRSKKPPTKLVGEATTETETSSESRANNETTSLGSE